MLQQTQVDRVIPRYLAWLERWPTADALAEATAGDVIRAWQGLGYNRRALALHRAAQVIASEGWPDDLTSLPGVGPYTAAAIRNFAFGEDVLPHDVNVDRVERRTGHSFTGEAAQALMDLGATVCLARIPRCEACPLAGDCPSRGTRDEPARKQGRFEGSFRQRRAETLRAVAAPPPRAASSTGRRSTPRPRRARRGPRGRHRQPAVAHGRGRDVEPRSAATPVSARSCQRASQRALPRPAVPRLSRPNLPQGGSEGPSGNASHDAACCAGSVTAV